MAGFTNGTGSQPNLEWQKKKLHSPRITYHKISDWIEALGISFMSSIMYL